MTDQRVKVFQVITKLDVGGAQETALALCEGLDDKRFETVLVSGADVGVGGHLLDEARHRGIQVEVVASLLRQLSPRSDLLALVALYRLFRRERPDVVHTHSSKAGVLGRVAARLAGTALIVHTVHGWSFRDYQRPTLQRFYQGIERVMAKCTDRIVVVADTDRAAGLAAGIGRPEQYVLIHSGISIGQPVDGTPTMRTALIDERTPGSDPIIGTVTRFRHPKDNLGFVRMAAMVVQQCPEARFVMIGDGPDRPTIEREIDALGLTDYVRLLGVRRDVTSLLGDFDVFVLASYSEGLPRAILEAMASRTTVVATRVGGVPEVVHDDQTGVLVPPGEPSALAAAVVSLLGNPQRAERLAAEARRRLDRYDVAETVRRSERMYEVGRACGNSLSMVCAGGRRERRRAARHSLVSWRRVHGDGVDVLDGISAGNVRS